MNIDEAKNIGSLSQAELEVKEAELWEQIKEYFDDDKITNEIFDVITQYGSVNYCLGFNKCMDNNEDLKNENKKLKETIIALQNQLEYEREERE